MVVDECCFMVDVASSFFDYFRISGWFHAPDDRLKDVAVTGAEVIGRSILLDQPHPGVESALGPRKGFAIQVLFEKNADRSNLKISFHTQAKRDIEVSVRELCEEREAGYEGRALFHKFLDLVRGRTNVKLLDVGGRSRSGVDRSQMFATADCTVLDILPGDNVDVVGDAHVMSKLFAPHSFDVVLSIATFEHLVMPWVVATEMSRIMKPGGIAFIATHQTIGMHDRPWDFWRFSDTAWDGLFNPLTGFEIIDRALEDIQFIVPHIYNAGRGSALEAAAGYLGSCVMVRKIGEPMVDWAAVPASAVVTTSYPTTLEPTPAWANDEQRL